MNLDYDILKAAENPVQETVDDVDALYLGLGASAPANLALRKRLGLKPGSPFGGLGFLDPQCQKNGGGPDCAEDAVTVPRHVTAELVRAIKLREFDRCSQRSPSMYFWALQPIYDASNSCVSAEVLARARNGANSAPYEDLKELAAPDAPQEIRNVYERWLAAVMLDWIPQILREYPVLRRLHYMSVNMRVFDLFLGGPLFQEVSKRLNAMSKEDRELVLSKVVIEVVEDQQEPEDMPQILSAWQDLGFAFSYDDTIGDLACEALGAQNHNFHLARSLDPLVQHFAVVKVDTDWAGYAIFLSHPSYSGKREMKAEVLRRAREEDRVYVPQQAAAGLKNTEAAHSALLAEFSSWCKRMIRQEKTICVELTLSVDDESHAFCFAKLRDLGLDMLGIHQANFTFQGGPTGAKAFEPAVLAAAAGEPRKRKLTEDAEVAANGSTKPRS